MLLCNIYSWIFVIFWLVLLNFLQNRCYIAKEMKGINKLKDNFAAFRRNIIVETVCGKDWLELTFGMLD